MAIETYTLPPLPYGLDALSPSISPQIMDLHYNRHHKTYITNLNAALVSLAAALSSNDLLQQLSLQPAIKFNAGGHINHTLFWANLTPPGSAEASPSAAPELGQAITARWGSDVGFRAAFEKAALGIQGSGWAWLVKSPDQPGAGGLEIVTSKDQDLPAGGKVVVLGLDMWEHAYYLQYWNNKKDYVARWWDVVNWKVAEGRWKAGGVEQVYGVLAGLAGRL